jgi:hypothetical protein
MQILFLPVLFLAAWPAQSAEPSQVPAAGENAGVPAAEASIDPIEVQRFREALHSFDSTSDPACWFASMRVVEEGFPQSRPVLVEALEGRSVRGVLFALRILGQRGDPGKDLEAMKRALLHPRPVVRLAAVTAIRSLGKEGLAAVEACLERDPDPKVRRLAVQVLEGWADPRSLPSLVGRLAREEEDSVRRQIVSALQAMTGKTLGDDREAWETLLEDSSMTGQADRIRTHLERLRQAGQEEDR